MKNFLVILLLSLLFCNFTNAERIKPPFIFTTDDKIPTAKDGESILTDKSSEIINEEYWSQPLTKLDYILMQFKLHAENNSKELSDGKTLGLYFEKFENPKSEHKLFGRYKDITVDNGVYFDESLGKIVVTFAIRDLGKAKEPMSEICKKLLRYDIMRYPLPDQEMRGYSYHNAILNELFRGDSYKNYNQYLKKIADNLVYVLSLNSEVLLNQKKDIDMFNMTCWKPDKTDNYIFRKWSLGFRR